MRTLILALFFVLLPQKLYADVSLSGQWYCNVMLDNKKESIIDFVTLDINESVTTFKVSISVTLTSRGEPISSLQFVASQEGTIEIDKNSIKLFPLKADVDVIEGSELITGEIRDELVGELFQDKMAIFNMKHLESLVINFEDARYTYDCIKHKHTIQ